ncbi:MAG: ExbD/TolR family protein [Burkholderiales bacterium]|nr:ExbD/TolR family protein [Burkholderiales bacterium]
MATYSRRRRGRRAMSDINVVPYIDVMLVLLIIFMVCAPLLVPGQIDLPSIGQSGNPPVAPLEVRLKKDASIMLVDRQAGGNEEPIDRRDLVKRVQALQKARPDLAVVIAADKNLRYEEVLRVMDVLQQNQVKRVGLLVKPANP